MDADQRRPYDLLWMPPFPEVELVNVQAQATSAALSMIHFLIERPDYQLIVLKICPSVEVHMVPMRQLGSDGKPTGGTWQLAAKITLTIRQDMLVPFAEMFPTKRWRAIALEFVGGDADAEVSRTKVLGTMLQKLARGE